LKQAIWANLSKSFLQEVHDQFQLFWCQILQCGQVWRWIQKKKKKKN